MMYNYPFFSFPRFRGYPSYYSTNFAKLRETYSPSISRRYVSKKQEPIREKSRQTVNDFPSSCSMKESSKTDNDEEVLFEILGLKLFYDDVLLICLIFFLYQEGVDDQYLFIALILLLLS